jgi:hypothetical protein
MLYFSLVEEGEEEKKKKGREKLLWRRSVSWGWTHLVGCAASDSC